MSHEFVRNLDRLRQDGVLESYRVFFSWYAQPAVWDALVELKFRDGAAVAAWNELEKSAPGGLDQKGLALGAPVMTSSADLVWTSSSGERSDDAVYYVIPYTFNSRDEYSAYAEAYVLPQYDGWLERGALDGYELFINRYPVGDPDPWDALAILHYKNFDAFGKRQKVLNDVRAGLRENPEWVAYHKRKGEIRSETENSIAELIATSE